MAQDHSLLTQAPALVALACPRCGGTPDPDGGVGHLARCGSCGVLGRLDDPESDRRLVAHAKVGGAEAWGLIGAELQRRGYESAPTPESAELLYLPFWRVVTAVAGRVEGVRRPLSRSIEREIDENGARFYTHVVRTGPLEDVSEEEQQVVISLVSACPLTELGAPRLDRRRQTIQGCSIRRAAEMLGEMEVFDATLRRRATVLDPLLTRRAACEEADALVASWCHGRCSTLEPGARSSIEPYHRDALLLYYPLQALQFSLDGDRCGALVDAWSGEIVCLTQPERVDSTGLERALAVGLGTAAGLLAGALLQGFLREIGFQTWLRQHAGGAVLAATIAGLLLYLGRRRRRATHS